MSALAFFEETAAALARDRMGGGGSDWAGSKFNLARRLPPRARGALGVDLVREWAVSDGRHVEEGSRGCDLVIDGQRVEVRTSFRWRDGGFSFAQLRDQEYDAAVLLGIEPGRVRLWWVPKSVCLTFPLQHGVETHWLQFRADDAPSWLNAYLVLDTQGAQS